MDPATKGDNIANTYIDWSKNLHQLNRSLSSLGEVTEKGRYNYIRESGTFQKEQPKKDTVASRVSDYWYGKGAQNKSDLLQGTSSLRLRTISFLRDTKKLLENPKINAELCKEIHENIDSVFKNIQSVQEGIHNLSLSEEFSKEQRTEFQTIVDDILKDFADTYSKIEVLEKKFKIKPSGSSRPLPIPPKPTPIKADSKTFRLPERVAKHAAQRSTVEEKKKPFANPTNAAEQKINEKYDKDLDGAFKYIESNIKGWQEQIIQSGKKELKFPYPPNETKATKNAWTIVVRENGGVYLHTHAPLEREKYIYTEKLAMRTDTGAHLNKTSRKPRNASEVQNIEREIDMMSRVRGMNHIAEVDHIVKSNTGKVTFYFRHYVNGNLDSAGQKMTTAQKHKAAMDITKTLESIHKRGKFVHMDVNAENIHVDEKMRVHIGGFHVARDFGSQITNRLQSIITASPEVWNVNPNALDKVVIKATTEMDVWSAGVVIYQLLANDTVPWITNTFLPDQIKENLSKDGFFPEPSDPWLHVCWEMCKHDPQDRITMVEAYNKFARLARP